MNGFSLLVGIGIWLVLTNASFSRSKGKRSSKKKVKKKGKISPYKARAALRRGRTEDGWNLTPRQKKYFKAVARSKK